MALLLFLPTDATNSLKTSVSNGKSSIASAITDKGVSTSATADFSTMASNIRAIPSGIGSLTKVGKCIRDFPIYWHYWEYGRFYQSFDESCYDFTLADNTVYFIMIPGNSYGAMRKFNSSNIQMALFDTNNFATAYNVNTNLIDVYNIS